MTLLKVLHLIWLLENAEIVELPAEEDEVHRAMNEFIKHNVSISPEMYFQITGTTQEDLHNNMKLTLTNVWKLTLLSKPLLLLKDSTLQKKKSKEINDLAAEYNMKYHKLLGTSPEMLNTISLAKKAASTTRRKS